MKTATVSQITTSAQAVLDALLVHRSNCNARPPVKVRLSFDTKKQQVTCRAKIFQIPEIPIDQCLHTDRKGMEVILFSDNHEEFIIPPRLERVLMVFNQIIGDSLPKKKARR